MSGQPVSHLLYLALQALTQFLVVRWQSCGRVYHHAAFHDLIGERLRLSVHGDYKAGGFCYRKLHFILDHLFSMTNKCSAPDVIEHYWKSLIGLLQGTEVSSGEAILGYSPAVAEHGGHKRVYQACFAAVRLTEYDCKRREPDHIAVL